MALTDLDKAIDAATAAITAPGGQLALGTANIRGVDYPVFEAAPQSLRDYLAFFLATHGYDAVPKGKHVEVTLSGAVYRLIPNGEKPGLCDIIAW